MHLQGTPQAVAIMEAIMRSSGQLSQVLKKKSPVKSWLYDNPRDVNVRVYEVPVRLNGQRELYKIKFVMDKRSELNKIDIVGQSMMEAIMDCVPDPSLGVSGIMIGEFVASRVEVVKLGVKEIIVDGAPKEVSDLGSRMHCPFCHGFEIHKCKEQDDTRHNAPDNSGGNAGNK